jgi:long-chain acyl-CoA synthetase
MKEATLNRMFLNRIAEGGDAVRYLVPREKTWEPMSYREVGTAVREMALGLMALGLDRGDKAAILSSTCVEWVLADIACILGGFIPVPIFPTELPDQVAFILSHSESRVVFVEDEVQWNKVAEVRESPPRLATVILLTGRAMGKEGTVDLAALREMGAAYGREHPDALSRRTEEIGPDDDLTIVYTSGTTGPPKGVVTRHRNYAFIVSSALEACKVNRGDVFLQFLPLAHSLGRLEHFLTFDAMAVSAFARSIQSVGEDLALVRPQVMVSVPRLYEKFYARVLAKVEEDGGFKKVVFHWALRVGREVSRRRQHRKPVDGLLALKFAAADRLVFRKIRARTGGRLRFFISGGAPLSREIAEFLHALDILILEGYGLTETSTVTSVNRIEHYKFGTVGKALPGTEIRIASDGEILIGGRHIFKEYFQDPAATREAIDADGWLHSGDIGVLDDEGFLQITDRKKDIIVTAGGKNIAPQNIENLLKDDAFVSQAFVYGDRRMYLVALITLSSEEIVKWARENGVDENDPNRIARHPRVEAMLRDRVEAVNCRLAPFEQVRKFVLLGTDFAQETGELTPTLKVRRKIVMEKYGDQLHALYDRD